MEEEEQEEEAEMGGERKQTAESAVMDSGALAPLRFMILTDFD